MAGSRGAPKQEARLVRLKAIRQGDRVKTSVKAKETTVVKVVRPAEDKVVIECSNNDVRTYHPEDQIILAHRPEDMNL